MIHLFQRKILGRLSGIAQQLQHCLKSPHALKSFGIASYTQRPIRTLMPTTVQPLNFARENNLYLSPPTVINRPTIACTIPAAKHLVESLLTSLSPVIPVGKPKISLPILPHLIEFPLSHSANVPQVRRKIHIFP